MPQDCIKTNIFELFEGHWLIDRIITGSMSGRFSGKAAIVPINANQLAFHESGQLAANGQVLDCYRQYLIQQLAHRTVVIKFIDGRDFLTLDFSETLQTQSQHICNLDTYYAVYEFVSANRFLVSFKVRGPQKRYEIQSIFTRLQWPFRGCHLA